MGARTIAPFVLEVVFHVQTVIITAVLIHIRIKVTAAHPIIIIHPRVQRHNKACLHLLHGVMVAHHHQVEVDSLPVVEVDSLPAAVVAVEEVASLAVEEVAAVAVNYRSN